MSTSAVRIHFRSDNWHVAQMRFKETPWENYITWMTKEDFDATPLPSPGDIWRSNWYKEGGEGPIAGYVICCPTCGDVHPWTTATNCEPKVDGVCRHSGTSSCWDWIGSAEEGTLSASPSLLCHTCGYHGWLRNGELTSC